jgi:hypothetical protein
MAGGRGGPAGYGAVWHEASKRRLAEAEVGLDKARTGQGGVDALGWPDERPERQPTSWDMPSPQ